MSAEQQCPTSNRSFSGSRAGDPTATLEVSPALGTSPLGLPSTGRVNAAPSTCVHPSASRLTPTQRLKSDNSISVPFPLAACSSSLAHSAKGDGSATSGEQDSVPGSASLSSYPSNPDSGQGGSPSRARLFGVKSFGASKNESELKAQEKESQEELGKGFSDEPSSDEGSGGTSSEAAKNKGKGPRKQFTHWTAEEDKVLLGHVMRHGSRHWSKLQASGQLPNRDHKACCNRFIFLKKRSGLASSSPSLQSLQPLGLSSPLSLSSASSSPSSPVPSSLGWPLSSSGLSHTSGSSPSCFVQDKNLERVGSSEELERDASPAGMNSAALLLNRGSSHSSSPQPLGSSGLPSPSPMFPAADAPGFITQSTSKLAQQQYSAGALQPAMLLAANRRHSMESCSPSLPASTPSFGHHSLRAFPASSSPISPTYSPSSYSSRSLPASSSSPLRAAPPYGSAFGASVAGSQLARVNSAIAQGVALQDYDAKQMGSSAFYGSPAARSAELSSLLHMHRMRQQQQQQQHQLVEEEVRPSMGSFSHVHSAAAGAQLSRPSATPFGLPNHRSERSDVPAPATAFTPHVSPTKALHNHRQRLLELLQRQQAETEKNCSAFSADVGHRGNTKRRTLSENLNCSGASGGVHSGYSQEALRRLELQRSMANLERRFEEDEDVWRASAKRQQLEGKVSAPARSYASGPAAAYAGFLAAAAEGNDSSLPHSTRLLASFYKPWANKSAEEVCVGGQAESETAMEVSCPLVKKETEEWVEMGGLSYSFRDAGLGSCPPEQPKDVATDRTLVSALDLAAPTDQMTWQQELEGGDDVLQADSWFEPSLGAGDHQGMGGESFGFTDGPGMRPDFLLEMLASS